MLAVVGFMKRGAGLGAFACILFLTEAARMHMEKVRRATLQKKKRERKKHSTKSWSKVVKWSVQGVSNGEIKHLHYDLNYSVSHQGKSKGKQYQFKKSRNRPMRKQDWLIRLLIRFVRNSP